MTLTLMKKRLRERLEAAETNANTGFPDWGALEIDLKAALELAKLLNRQDKGIYDE